MDWDDFGYVFKFSEVEIWRKWLEMGPGLRWRAQIWSIWIENELIKRFKTLPGPGEAKNDQKLPKRTKTGKIKKIRIFSPYETPDQPLWAAYIT